MLGNPVRGIMFNSPSSLETYNVKCSFCNKNSSAKPYRIMPKDMPRWESHTCDSYKCLGFNCMKRFVETGGNEFYVANNKHLMCYKCKKLDGSNAYELRPFDKLPENAEIYPGPYDTIRYKTTAWYKKRFPFQFEGS